jgi:hypothetical protein
MQGIMETLFDIFYLGSVLFIGTTMWRGSSKGSLVRRFAVMAVVLGAGDAFHLIPRSYALLTTGLENHAASLGVGKLITSLTMTVFYVMLFETWKQRYEMKNSKGVSFTIYSLAVARIGLSLMPQNDWLSPNAPVLWGIYRNLPFALMGLIIIVLFYKETRRTDDRIFWSMPLAIALSFAFYVPVVLWADQMPLLGILMIPKTLAYVWVVMMGYSLYKRQGQNPLKPIRAPAR